MACIAHAVSSVLGRVAGLWIRRWVHFGAEIARYRCTLRSKMSTFPNREIGRPENMTICRSLNIGRLIEALRQSHGSTFSQQCFLVCMGGGGLHAEGATR